MSRQKQIKIHKKIREIRNSPQSVRISVFE